MNWIRSCGIRAGILSILVMGFPLVSLAAEAEEHHPGIISLNMTFFLQAINFIILAFILYRVLFKPLTIFVQKRAEGIQQSLEEAKRAREDVARARAEYEESLKTARQEAAALRQRMDREMTEERERLVQQSREEANRLITQARSEIEQEVRRAKADLRGEAVNLSISTAERLIQRNLADEDQQRLAEQYIEELGRTS